MHDTDQTHDTDQPHDTDDAEPAEGYFDREDADDEIDAEDPADPDADVEDDDAIALGPVGTDEATDEDADVDDPDTTGIGGVVVAERPAGPDEDDEIDGLAAEPVVVELEETEVEVLDEPVDDEGADDDESVLLTESAPGSVLPSEEPEEPEELEEPVEPVEPVVADELDEEFDEELDEPVAAVEPEPRPEDLLEPVGADMALDPGSGSYQERWSAIQGAFVDEPRRAVESAGALVAQMWHDFERSIAEQRAALDDGWADDSPTDDLRDAFKRYRTMFTQLTTLLDDPRDAP